MSNTSNIRTGRHVVFNMHIHLVFVTKYRHAVFSKEMLLYLKNIFNSICDDFESDLIELNIFFRYNNISFEKTACRYFVTKTKWMCMLKTTCLPVLILLVLLID